MSKDGRMTKLSLADSPRDPPHGNVVMSICRLRDFDSRVYRP